MASAAEALGMSLPGSSSFPAEYPEKLRECATVGAAMRNLLEKNILPRDIMTRSAFENAMVRTSCFANQNFMGSLTGQYALGVDYDFGRID